MSAMRTTVVIDDALFREASRRTAIRMKRRLIEAGLHALIRQQRLDRLADMLGKTRLSLTPARLARLRRSRLSANA